MNCNKIIRVTDGSGSIWLGVWDTLNILSQTFDISPWLERLGDDGEVLVIAQRKGDEIPYQVTNVTVDKADGTVTWTFSESDTAVPGYGSAALAYIRDGEYLARTVAFMTCTSDTIGGSSDVPDPWEQWFNQVLRASKDAQEAADDAAASAEAANEAAAHTPII